MLRKKTYYILILLILFITPGIIFAAQKLNIDWPTLPGSEIRIVHGMDLSELVAYFYEWGIALGGLAAFIALIIAGFQYMTSVGDPTKMKESIDRIKSAFFGLVLLLASFLILNTINPHLVNLRDPLDDFEGVGRGVDAQPKKTFLHPCTRITLYPEREFEGIKTKIILHNCLPISPRVGGHGAWPLQVPENCLQRKLLPGRWIGSFRLERHENGTWTSNCFCRIDVFDDAQCKGWGAGGLIGQINTPIVRDFEIEVLQMGRELEMQSIGFLEFEKIGLK